MLLSQTDSIPAKKRKNRFGIELGVGKPATRVFSEEWLKTNPGNSAYIRPIDYFHVNFTYSLNKRNHISYNFFFGGFRTRYQQKNYYQHQANDSIYVYSKLIRDEKDYSLSAGFSLSKKLKLNNSGNLFFAPEGGLLINILIMERTNIIYNFISYRHYKGQVDGGMPLETYNSEGLTKESVFKASGSFNNQYSLSPLLRMALIKTYKKFNLNLNYNIVFMPYYSVSYYKQKASWQFSNISIGINF